MCVDVISVIKRSFFAAQGGGSRVGGRGAAGDSGDFSTARSGGGGGSPRVMSRRRAVQGGAPVPVRRVGGGQQWQVRRPSCGADSYSACRFPSRPRAFGRCGRRRRGRIANHVVDGDNVCGRRFGAGGARRPRFRAPVSVVSSSDKARWRRATSLRVVAAVRQRELRLHCRIALWTQQI